MSDDGNFNRIQKKVDAQIGQKIFYTNEDFIVTPHKNNLFTFKLRRVALFAAMFIFAVILAGVFNLKTEIDLPNEISVATIMTIDINPSVKLSLDDNGRVLEVKAINQDAETLDFSGIVGLSAENAVEKIVSLALDAGFINSDDLVEDYVLITTISLMDENDSNLHVDTEFNPQLDALKVKIEDKVRESNVLQDVNVAIIKATKVDLRLAEDKKVPVGLYVLQGNQDDQELHQSVKEYFSHPDQVVAFKNKGEIIPPNKEAKLKLINKFIEKLKFQSYDVTSLENELSKEDVDVDNLLEQIRTIWGQFDNNINGGKPGDISNESNNDEKNNGSSNPDNGSSNSGNGSSGRGNNSTTPQKNDKNLNDNKTNEIETTEADTTEVDTSQKDNSSGSNNYNDKDKGNNKDKDKDKENDDRNPNSDNTGGNGNGHGQ
jgi:hypothetical protein